MVDLNINKNLKLIKLSSLHIIKLHKCLKEDNFKFTSFTSHKTLNQTKIVVKNLIKKQQKKYALHFCVQYKKEIVGLFSILNLPIKKNYQINKTELAFWIKRSHQRKNFAFLCCKKLIEICKIMKIRRLTIFSHRKNIATYKLSLKLGFKKLCLMKKLYLKNNRYIDAFCYEKIIY